MTNLRHYRRIPFRTDAEVRTGAATHHCKLVDLALRGALFKANDRLPLQVGDKAVLKIALPDSELELIFDAELIHYKDDHYGFLFASEDLDTLAHLRRLLELNFGDAEQADREFSNWLQSAPDT